MLKRIWNKRNFILLFIILILSVMIIWNVLNQNKIYSESFTYYGERITFTVYDKVNHKKLTEEINNIYKKYVGINDLGGKLSSDDKKIIEYGKIAYYKTDGYVDFTAGNLIYHLKNGEDYTFTSEVENVLIDGKLDGDFSFNFDSMIGAYATNEVLYYFKQNDINQYIVNENGDVAAGEHYNKEKYSVSINNPNNDLVEEIVYIENKALATRNKADTFKSYMVNPKTSKIEKKYDSVVVIAGDNLTANMLVNALYLMDIGAGRELIEGYGAQALWIDGEDIIKTDGFDEYIKK